MIRMLVVKVLHFHVICVQFSLQCFYVKMKGYDKDDRSQGVTFSCNLCSILIAMFLCQNEGV